ncbi:MAG TPA: flagellar assembly protein FliW [Polyangiaceae bacterium]|nr:flagellar assembly protein FliW [Polyangiaceae bacterium]
MKVNTSRFGMLDLRDDDVIRFPVGVIGFPNEHSFVLLRRREGSPVGWLQSTTTPWLALPVVSVDALQGAYSGASVEGSIESVGLEFRRETCAVLVVLTAAPAVRPTVNLLAPIVICSERRAGAQVLIEGSEYTTREPFVLREPVGPVAEPAREASTAASASPHAF